MILTIDLAMWITILTFLYEFLIGNALILYNWSFSILRYSLPYIFIFFFLCLFNSRYTKLKFFGIDLQQYKYNSKITYLVFMFKEYNYWILFMLNFLFIILLFYYVMHKNFIISGLIISVYLFIGLSIYIKRLLIKHNYYNKKTYNMCINMIFAAIFGLYIAEAGDTIEQYLGFKLNLGEFFYGFLNHKDKLLLQLRNDNIWNNYKWWHINDLYKNQKASLNYLYLKNKIINKNLLTDITHNNKNEYLHNNNIKDIINNVKNDYQIQTNKINFTAVNNNIYTDKNMVYYMYKYFDNQADLLKKVNYSQYLENKKLKLYIFNQKGFTAGDLVPKGIKNNYNLLGLLDLDKNNTMHTLKNVLLDQNIAKSFNYYLELQNQNKHFLDLLLNKNISGSINKFLLFKFTKTSILDVLKEQNLFKTNNNIDSNNYIVDKFQKYIKIITIYFNDNFNTNSKNYYLYSYNKCLNWWEKQHYILSNFFKGYNIKKYAPLTKYNFEEHNVLYNLFKKDATDAMLKPIKNGQIHDVKFKFKLANYGDRNLLYFKYTQTLLNKLANVNELIEYNENEYTLNLVKNEDNEFIFIIKKNPIYQPTTFENFLHDLDDLVHWSKSTTLKNLYFKYYPPKMPEITKFSLKNPYVIYSENFENYNKNLTALHAKIDTLNLTEYKKNFQNFLIYNNLLNTHMDNEFNDNINDIDDKINKVKKFNSIVKNNNYNNNNYYSTFKANYNGVLNDLNDILDDSTYKSYIMTIANNLDTTISGNLYFQQFLYETADYLADYFNYHKIPFGQFLNQLEDWHSYFNKYAAWESEFLKRNEYYNFYFKTVKNPYLDRSIYFKEYLKAQAAVDAEIAYNSQFSCYAERVVAEKLTMINNNATICNLAYDAKIAMLHEDLNAFIDEKESVWLFKGELKSCNKAAYYLTRELQELAESKSKSLAIINEKYKLYWKEVRQGVLDVYKDIEDIEQLQRVFSNFTEEEIAGLITEGEDIETLEYALNFDAETSELMKQDINTQYTICVKYLSSLKAKEQLIILDTYCCSLEELLENITTMRDADQYKLTWSIENKLRSLKEFSENKAIWLAELEEQKILKEQLKLQQELEQLKQAQKKLMNKDWSWYNYKSLKNLKNEIIAFKNKK